MRHKFDSFELDTKNFVLSRDGTAIKVEPLVFDLLAHLLDRANQVVSKDELLESVWQGRIVSDTTIASAIKSARKAIGDSGSAQRYIKTIHGRGFTFALLKPDSKADATSSSTKTVERFDSPSLLVLIEIDADCSQSKQVDEDLSYALERIFARVPLLRISSEGVRIKKSRDSLSPRQIYELVECDYLLEGRISGAPNTSLSMQLIDAKAGLLLNSKSYSYDALPAEELVKRATVDIVGQFEPQLLKAIYNEIKTQNLESSAEAKFFEASGLLALKGWHRASFEEATDLLKQSIELAPDFSHAHAYLSLLLAFGHRIGVLRSRETAVQEALTHADQAMDIESHDSTVLGFCGCALADVGLADRGLSILDKSLSIDPDNSQALVAKGAARLMKYELDGAIEDMERGIAMSPLDSRLAVWRSVLASAYLSKKDFEKAHQQARQGCIDDHRTYMPRVALAGAEFAKGNVEASLAALAEAKAINPDIGDYEICAILGKSLGGKVSALSH